VELPPRQRAAVVLRHYEGLSERETAAWLGISEGSVKAHVSRGLVRLRALLDAEGATNG
jgi:RNA polymerase sigma factor (sigma-70 family)